MISPENPISAPLEGRNVDQQHSGKLAGSVIACFLICLLALAVFQSSALLTLTYDLAPSAFADYLVGLAQVWHETMEHWGMAQTTVTIEQWVEDIHQIRASDPQAR